MVKTEQIVAFLIAERNRLEAAIQALHGPAQRRGRAAVKKASASTPNYRAPVVAEHAAAKAPVKRKHKISAAARKAMADAAKKRWAAIKAGKAPNPFAKVKRKTATKG
jgi:hypothetical protein